jgi:hypothetical protein
LERISLTLFSFPFLFVFLLFICYFPRFWSLQIEQSRRPDRTRHALGPIVVELSATSPRKITVPRLHFSETTAGNMRKKGKPNPNQRYFSIILTLVASIEGGHSVPLCAMESERIIVRAANLNVFSENEAPLHWAVGAGPQSIIHFGHVGINTDNPTEALTVHGNVQVTGAVLQPSDRRVKEDIVSVGAESDEQLANIRKLKLYRYNLKPEWASYAGRADERAGDASPSLFSTFPFANVADPNEPTCGVCDGAALSFASPPSFSGCCRCLRCRLVAVQEA